MKRSEQSAVLSIRVHPVVKSEWDKLPKNTKSLLIKKFQMEILGIRDDIPDDVTKFTRRIEYDEKSLEALKEILVNHEKKLLEAQERLERLESWKKMVINFLLTFIEVHASTLCDMALPEFKKRAKELVDTAP